MKTYKVKITRESIVEAKDEEEAKDLAFDSMIMGDVDFEVEEDESQFRMILMWHHPKYYAALAKIRKQFEKEQADKRASEQAIQETVPHNDIEEANEQESEQASAQASEQDSSNKR